MGKSSLDQKNDSCELYVEPHDGLVPNCRRRYWCCCQCLMSYYFSCSTQMRRLLKLSRMFYWDYLYIHLSLIHWCSIHGKRVILGLLVKSILDSLLDVLIVGPSSWTSSIQIILQFPFFLIFKLIYSLFLKLRWQLPTFGKSDKWMKSVNVQSLRLSTLLVVSVEPYLSYIIFPLCTQS